MKKFLSMLLAVAMLLTVCAFSVAETTGFDGEIKVWVADAAVEFTKAQIDAFKAANAEYANMTVTVEPMGEGDAATAMITDVESGADIYGFAQDQLSRLVAAGALEEVAPDNVPLVTAENDAGSVAAATLTSDNGYFLYYDKSVVTDPNTLETIIADCEKAGKGFYMEINSGWYQTAFFFGAGCTLTYDVNNEGSLVACHCDYASENGVKALKAMISVAKSPAFSNASSASNATNIGAIVDGAWDAKTVQEKLGDNYAATKLPTVAGYQMGGFGGFKLLGVKPQTDDAKLAACDALAYYLASGDVQAARYDALQWGPSNLEAQKLDAIQTNAALSALAAQLSHCVGQGQYPNDYWSLATALADSVIAGEYDNYTDEQLLEVLQTFQDTAISYAAN